jgi:hypothetical protein
MNHTHAHRSHTCTEAVTTAKMAATTMPPVMQPDVQPFSRSLATCSMPYLPRRGHKRTYMDRLALGCGVSSQRAASSACRREPASMRARVCGCAAAGWHSRAEQPTDGRAVTANASSPPHTLQTGVATLTKRSSAGRAAIVCAVSEPARTHVTQRYARTHTKSVVKCRASGDSHQKARE